MGFGGEGMEQAAAVIRKSEKRSRYYDRVHVLTCAIEYPEFVSKDFPWILNRINQEYRQRTAAFFQNCLTELYAVAVEDYLYAARNDYPFTPHEAMTVFTVPYNRSCTLSMYFDAYQYTGGAHGATVRTSDTWSLSKGRRLALSDFFPDGFDLRAYILEQIDAQITARIDAGNDIFFDDPAQLAREYFDEQNFYLTSDGIVIYYQLYTVAPYASGIVEFLIPWVKGTVIRPGCEP
jgi:hypothetical protein